MAGGLLLREQGDRGRAQKIKSYLDYGMFQPIQIASIMALNGPQDCVTEIYRGYKVRRDCLVDGLAKIGWEIPKPKATMFVWARIPDKFKHMASLEFSKMLIDKAKVAVSPGIGFGEDGEGRVRFALIENEHRTRQAIKGLKKAFGEYFMKSKIDIGLIGLGTVGSGVVKLLRDNAEII